MEPRVVRSTPLPLSFGRYTLFDLIGKGGMAEIYLARQSMQLGAARLCIVKQILPELAGDPRFSDMLVHEAKLAARLSHANVVQVFDLGREDDRLFIAMEYVEGFDLNALLARCSRAKVPLPFALAVEIVREALLGLDYAHRRTDDDGRLLGIVHRDVSPSNVLVSFDGEVKVCDFGIARANDAIPQSSHELDEALRGKAGYMSPEHARGEAVDARADVFAAGIILWELAAGRRMYRAADAAGASLLEQARRAEVPPLPTGGLPRDDLLQAVLARALATDREARYASAAAMLRDLDAYAAEAKLVTNALELGEWLAKNFGAEMLARRRARERAVVALEKGAPLVVSPVAPPAPDDASTAARAPTTADARASVEAQASVDTQSSLDARPGVDARESRRRRRASTLAFVAVAVAAVAGTLLAMAAR